LIVDSITKNNVLVEYEAQVTRAGKRSEIKVGADGKSIDALDVETRVFMRRLRRYGTPRG